MNVNSIIMKIENKKPIPINEPVLDILMMYKNKKSKKVGYARTQLMRRYEGQSYVRQHAILREFLRGDRKACNWAARQLRYDWRESFAEAMAQMNFNTCGKVVNEMSSLNAVRAEDRKQPRQQNRSLFSSRSLSAPARNRLC